MLEYLAKLAARSEMLREAALEKQAGFLGGALRVIGGTAIKHPAGTAVLGASTMAGVGRARQTKANFDPKVQQYMADQGQ